MPRALADILDVMCEAFQGHTPHRAHVRGDAIDADEDDREGGQSDESNHKLASYGEPGEYFVRADQGQAGAEILSANVPNNCRTSNSVALRPNLQ